MAEIDNACRSRQLLNREGSGSTSFSGEALLKEGVISGLEIVVCNQVLGYTFQIAQLEWKY